jgi:transcriptional regulator GlxA family with amidase domain
MKHVSILVPRGHTSLVNIEGTHQILSNVNGFLQAQGSDPLFDVHLVGLARHTRQSTGLFTVNPDSLIGEVTKTDLIIIPAIHGDQQEAVERNRKFLPWIVGQYNKGAEVASFCIGAYFLAATGLLRGKQCATHWLHANDFRKMFPEVNLVDDTIMTETDGIYTSGGAYSSLNLLLYLIEKYAGREIAVLTAKTFMIDIDRNSQSPFIIFQGQKTHEDEPIKRTQKFIEDHYQEKILVGQLANRFALSRRNLERRFRKATRNSITEYVQRVKMEVAKKNLETGNRTVSEVMFEVGYSDTKAFRTIFKRITGLSPIQYRNKYSSVNRGT